MQAFHDRLAADFRSRSGKKLNLFLDREGLNTGDVLSDRLKKALNASAILIPILSPTYLSSRWCRREFLHFMEQAGDRLIVGGSSRIVPVQLMPYDRYEAESNEDQTQLRKITGFLSEKEILYKNFYRHPLPIRPEEPAFDNCIAELSNDIFPLLKSVRELPANGTLLASKWPSYDTVIGNRAVIAKRCPSHVSTLSATFPLTPIPSPRARNSPSGSIGLANRLAHE